MTTLGEIEKRSQPVMAARLGPIEGLEPTWTGHTTGLTERDSAFIPLQRNKLMTGLRSWTPSAGANQRTVILRSGPKGGGEVVPVAIDAITPSVPARRRSWRRCCRARRAPRTSRSADLFPARTAP